MSSPLRGLGAPMRSRSFRGLWLSLLMSSLGDWAARLALTILVLDRTHSAALSSLVVAVSFVPWLGPGQIVATRLGHLPRVPVMVGADLLRAGIFAVLLLHLPTWGLLLLVFAAATATPPFEAARSALTVEAVDADDYGAAVALLDLTDQSAIVVGYLVGGAAVLVGGVRVALLVDVASFLLSAVVLARIHEHHQGRTAEPVARQLGRGVRLVWNEPVVRRAMVALLVVALPVAAVEATSAAYARLVLHAGAGVTGELAAAVPIGIIVIVPLLPTSGPARRLLRVAALVAVIGALGAGLAFGLGGLAGALVGYLAAGVLSGSATPAQIAFQPRIDTQDRPAVFSVAQGLVMGGQALGAAAGGALAAAAGPRRADLGWMALVLVVSLLAVVAPVRDVTGPVATGPGSDGGDDTRDATGPPVSTPAGAGGSGSGPGGTGARGVADTVVVDVAGAEAASGGSVAHGTAAGGEDVEVVAGGTAAGGADVEVVAGGTAAGGADVEVVAGGTAASGADVEVVAGGTAAGGVDAGVGTGSVDVGTGMGAGPAGPKRRRGGTVGR